MASADKTRELVTPNKQHETNVAIIRNSVIIIYGEVNTAMKRNLKTFDLNLNLIK